MAADGGGSCSAWVVGRTAACDRRGLNDDDLRRTVAPNAEQILLNSPLVRRALSAASAPPESVFARKTPLDSAALGIVRLAPGQVFESMQTNWSEQEQLLWRLR
eukprot:9961518-Alexandrium_andersonii.AAC.1